MAGSDFGSLCYAELDLNIKLFVDFASATTAELRGHAIMN